MEEILKQAMKLPSRSSQAKNMNRWRILRSLLPVAPLLSVLSSCSSYNGSFPPPKLPPAEAPPQVFDRYRAEWDSNMADGWTCGMDISGVSLDKSRTATLITPRHVVMAKHFARRIGDPVIFHDRQGKRLKRKLVQMTMGTGDVMVGLLDEPVPANHTHYPLPAAGVDLASLLGQPVIVSDQTRCLFVHQIAAIKDGRIAFQHDKSKTHGWGKKLVVGDSGNPSFLIVGRELVLIETHSTGGAGTGPFYGDPAVQAGVRAAVVQLDGSYRIRTVRVS